MPGVSAPNNTEPKGPKHLNMIEMAAPSTITIENTGYFTKFYHDFVIYVTTHEKKFIY